MNILETVLKAAGGTAVSTIAKNFGINGSQATDVIGHSFPHCHAACRRTANRVAASMD